jgi:hypothetical protein
LKEKLDMAILNDKKCKNIGRLNVSKDLSKTIRKEIVVSKKNELVEHMKTIKLTSVESKREVATLSPVTKLRSSLEDDTLTLNALCFLRTYFTKEKKAQNEKKSVILI